MENKYKTMPMVSYYVGEPKIGIAKSSGTLTVWDDRLVFDKVFGSALGNISLAGMLIARKKELEKEKTIVFTYPEIKQVRESRYMGFQPMLTVDLNTGETHSFAGLFNPADTCRLIEKLMSESREKNRMYAPTGSRSIPQASATAASPNGPYEAFYCQDSIQPGPKKIGEITLLSDGVAFRENASGQQWTLPLGDIQRVAENRYLEAAPMLDITTKDGRIHHFFQRDLPTAKLKDAIEARMKKLAAVKKKVCKYCGHVYEKGEIFCTACGGMETIES